MRPRTKSQKKRINDTPSRPSPNISLSESTQDEEILSLLRLTVTEEEGYAEPVFQSGTKTVTGPKVVRSLDSPLVLIFRDVRRAIEVMRRMENGLSGLTGPEGLVEYWNINKKAYLEIYIDVFNRKPSSFTFAIEFKFV